MSLGFAFCRKMKKLTHMFLKTTFCERFISLPGRSNLAGLTVDSTRAVSRFTCQGHSEVTLVSLMATQEHRVSG